MGALAVGNGDALRSYVANEQQFLAAAQEGKQALRDKAARELGAESRMIKRGRGRSFVRVL